MQIVVYMLQTLLHNEHYKTSTVQSVMTCCDCTRVELWDYMQKKKNKNLSHDQLMIVNPYVTCIQRFDHLSVFRVVLIFFFFYQLGRLKAHFSAYFL